MDNIDQIKFLSDEITRLNKELERLKDEKLDLIQVAIDNCEFENKNYNLIQKEISTSNIDVSLLREKYPEIAREVSKTNKYNRFYIKDKQNKDTVMEEAVLRMVKQ